MKSDQLRNHHIESFSKLTLSERLAWAFAQHQFLSQFMDTEAKLISKKTRRYGKKYFKHSNLA